MNRVGQILGIARKANKIVSGEDLVLKEIRRKSASLVILSTDAAVNIEKKITQQCMTHSIPLFQYGVREELGRAIGKSERVVLAITDKGLSKLVTKLLSKN